MTNEIELQSRPAITPQRTKRRSKSKPGVPYAGATSGDKARVQAVKILQGHGCEQVGFMDDFEKQDVILAFRHRGRPVEIRASVKGWAQLYLRKHPRTRDRHAIFNQGRIAVNSMLRDWVKGSVTAIECGILSFEAVFMPHMITNDGRSVIDRAQELLPKPAEQKVVSLPKPAA